VQYAQRQLVVNGSNDGELTVSIVSMAGQQLSSMTVQLANGTARIPVSTLPSGAYVAVVTDANGQKATCKFVKSNR